MRSELRGSRPGLRWTAIYIAGCLLFLVGGVGLEAQEPPIESERIDTSLTPPESAAADDNAETADTVDDGDPAEPEEILLGEDGAAPYLGFFRFEENKVIVEVLLRDGRLVVDVPGLGAFELDPPSAAPPEDEDDIADDADTTAEEVDVDGIVTGTGGIPEDGGKGKDCAPKPVSLNTEIAAGDASSEEVDPADLWTVRGVKGFTISFNAPDGETLETAEKTASLTLHRPDGSRNVMRRDDDLISFNVQIGGADGPSLVEGMAGSFELQPDEYLLATEGVRLRYRGIELNARTLRVDIPTRHVTAEGDVLFIDGRQYLSGDTLDMELDTKTGKLTNAKARVEPEFYFSGREIAKVGDQVYTIVDGELTSCNEEVPAWSFALSRARITLGEYAHIKNARMRLKKVPVLWVPRMIWPATTERTSGFLVPQPTFSERRGIGLGVAYYQTLGRSADTTFYFEATGKEFFEIGNKTRYRPSETTEGEFEYLFQREPDNDLTVLFPGIENLPVDQIPAGLPDEDRWKFSWLHTSDDVLGGFRAVIDFEDYSDPAYRLDSERNPDRQTNNFIHSQAYLSKNIGQQSFNILVDQRERINISRISSIGGIPIQDRKDGIRAGRISDIRRNLPEIEYRLRPTQLGSLPLYFDVDANAHYLSFERFNVRRTGVPANRPGAFVDDQDEYGRFDIFPNFSIPLSTIPWLSVKLDLGGRFTYYSNTINRETNLFFGNAVDPTTGQSLGENTTSADRTLGVTKLEIVGPSISRIFEKSGEKGKFAKFKHIVEPRIDYEYRDDFEDNFDEDGRPILDEDNAVIPLFDEIDSFQLTNFVTVSLINRLLAKPRDEEDSGAFEIASFELSQTISLDNNDPFQVAPSKRTLFRKQEGPLRALVRFNPSLSTSLKFETRYSTLFDEIQSTSLTGSAKFGEYEVGGSWLRQRRLDVEQIDGTTGALPEDFLFTNEINSDQLRIFTTLALTKRLKIGANVSFDLDLEDNINDQRSNPINQRYLISYSACCWDLLFELREDQFGGITDRDFRFSFSLKNVGRFIDLNGSF